jgi:hypothetical protein
LYVDYDLIAAATALKVLALMREEQIAATSVTYFEYDSGAQLRMQIFVDGNNNFMNVGTEVAGCDVSVVKTGNVSGSSEKTFCIRIESM